MQKPFLKILLNFLLTSFLRAAVCDKRHETQGNETNTNKSEKGFYCTKPKCMGGNIVKNKHF